MRIIGADLSPDVASGVETANTVVSIDADGRVQAVRRPGSLAGVAVDVGDLAAGEPFLFGLNLPVVVPHRAARQRPVEGLVRRKLGYRLPPGGRAAPGGARGVPGDAILAALSAAGHPCLPYPDRDGRRSGVAEVAPGLALKILLWEGSPAARAAAAGAERAAAFRSYAAPDYRSDAVRGRAAGGDRAAALDLITRALSGAEDFDVRVVQDALAQATGDADIRHAASLLDACLVAGTARRYLRDAEASVFLGDRENGYVILPADGLVRRLVLGDAPAGRGRLFPKGSLRQRLGAVADLRAVDLLGLPGRPEKNEAVFHTPPAYEFDNLDELLWWKHCRHLSGVSLPTEGLTEMVVALEVTQGRQEHVPPLRLVRSRHRTLSFRFDPPAAWRARVATRDGRTYPFRVLRATYSTAG